MAPSSSRALAVLVTSLIAAALVPSPVSADIIVELTVHETLDGPAMRNLDTCSFYVKGIGLLAATGTLRILSGSPGDTVEVAQATFTGTENDDGVFDVVAGPIQVSASFAGLVAVADYAEEDFPDLRSGAFDVDCPQPESAACDVTPFLPPIGTPGHTMADGTQRFRFGQTVPVNLKISCQGGAPYAPPTIFVAKLDGDLAAEQAGTSKSSRFDGNHLRQAGNHWHYNLDTSDLTKGLWRVRVDVGDGADHFVWMRLR